MSIAWFQKEIRLSFKPCWRFTKVEWKGMYMKGLYFGIILLRMSELNWRYPSYPIETKEQINPKIKESYSI